MASLEQRGSTFRAKFRYAGRQLSCSLKTDDHGRAEALLKRLEANLHDVEHGRLIPPQHVDVGVFLLSDGRSSEKPHLQQSMTLSDLFARYESLEGNAKEANTRRIESIHLSHLKRILGGSTRACAVDVPALQNYINARSRESGRGGAVSHVTIRKEVGTLASLWNRWAAPAGHVSGVAPTKGLRYQKIRSKHPFQTCEQIERTIRRGKLRGAGAAVLWDSVYLNTREIADVLNHVKLHACSGWVYPAFVFAAYTGARRSEILRSRIDDIDFSSGMVRIREKKKDQSRQLTFRHVPLFPFVGQVLRSWLAGHPGGELTFCTKSDVEISDGLARHYFMQAVGDSKWNVLRGWHVFRHSFISNAASRGIDERMIREWVGHLTDEMARRYRHLFPEQQQKALALVFQDG